MKPPKNEPYQRSRHRATLHAWVVAATSIAAIGLPAAAMTPQRDNTELVSRGQDATETRDAREVAAQWIDALQSADLDAAWSMMQPPSLPTHQASVLTDLDVLAELLAQEDVRVEPIAHRRAGHWAMSAWSVESLSIAQAPLIEPIALYNPAADDLIDSSVGSWHIVAQSSQADPALKPLYNADYDALQAWVRTLL